MGCSSLFTTKRLDPILINTDSTNQFLRKFAHDIIVHPVSSNICITMVGSDWCASALTVPVTTTLSCHFCKNSKKR